ncbi:MULTISPECIES: response regulator transcription factor [Pseudonocardia]|uniref:DNA-binding response regulator MtrA n=2 Tax=Pseudonocardia TaxID=1847 RepID=A0A1Y2MIE5_PSEAH|nr:MULTISPECIES: response regulator transcription factor [Pseudonocardia]OSY34851.1 DNA-binding response regulator MtrA [Pseudonocardia autotrophica]TDN75450.1 DNA-binding response OmpR family regulator [Pseudonocardia autotrophica]BBF99415.1 DNA-binding response regulator [Pseudonocardia autotrophica]GEC29341.1 DNA-binding response regulator [Pseudonocardia saturnea]
MVELEVAQGGVGSRTRVLIVDDDVRIGQALGLALDDEGFDVDAVHTGEEALSRAGAPEIDLVLLDLMLPGIDGLTVCRRLRDAGDLPIIMVTARSDSADVIAGLEAGADDYVTKPLVAGELAARIRALLRRRRPAPATPRRLLLGDVELRPDEGVVLRAGEPVHLTRTEFRLLAELAAAGGRIVTRDELLSRVWGYEYHGDTRLLDVHVRRLRRKVEADPDRPTVVLTVRGAGYKAGQVERRPDPAVPDTEPVPGWRG